MYFFTCPKRESSENVLSAKFKFVQHSGWQPIATLSPYLELELWAPSRCVCRKYIPSQHCWLRPINRGICTARRRSICICSCCHTGHIVHLCSIFLLRQLDIPPHSKYLGPRGLYIFLFKTILQHNVCNVRYMFCNLTLMPTYVGYGDNYTTNLQLLRSNGIREMFGIDTMYGFVPFRSQHARCKM